MSLDFAESARSSVGVEWELQLVDMDTNDLRQAADAVIERAWKDPQLKPFIHREMMLNTVEVTSGAHQSVAGCLADLRQSVAAVRPLTNELRIDVATAGSHPFARPAYQRVTDSARYEDLVERTRYWGRQMLLFGVHVHVGIEQRAKVLPILNAVLAQSGQLQALAASSPYWAGTDTGYASNRAMVFQQLPNAGLPRQFESWQQLEQYYADIRGAGMVDGFDEVRWDIRPAPHLGTLEVRLFDACTNILEVEAVASLTHALIEHYSRLWDAGEPLPQLPDWFNAENKWRSARYGVDATLITDSAGGQVSVRDSLAELVDTLRPAARDLGCEAGLDLVPQILEMGPSYERQRAVAALHPDSSSRDMLGPRGSLDAVVGLMRAEMQADRPLSAEEFMDDWAQQMPSVPS